MLLLLLLLRMQPSSSQGEQRLLSKFLEKTTTQGRVQSIAVLPMPNRPHRTWVPQLSVVVNCTKILQNSTGDYGQFVMIRASWGSSAHCHPSTTASGVVRSRDQLDPSKLWPRKQSLYLQTAHHVVLIHFAREKWKRDNTPRADKVKWRTSVMILIIGKKLRFRPAF